MRLLLTSVTCPKGELTANLERHLLLWEKGSRLGCDLVLLPEMSLTGYRPGAAISLGHPAVETLVAATASGPALCFGLVEMAEVGRPLITQVVAAGGSMKALHHKAHLGEGEDADFQMGIASAPFTLADVSCSLAVCAEIGSEASYDGGATVVLGPAAPGLYGARRASDEQWRSGFDWWVASLRDDASRLLRPGQLLAVSTQAGATDDEDFPGWAGLIGRDGRILAGLPDWREGEVVVELPPIPQRSLAARAHNESEGD